MSEPLALRPCSYGTMARVFRRRARFALVAALVIMLVGPAVARADLISASVSATPTGQAMGSGFLGVSFEYRAIHQYTGRNPLAIDPVLIRLLKAMAPGQTPILRIGGDSADGTWWPIPGMIAPGGLYYRLTPGWMRTTHALASDLGAKLILGINLAAGRPAIAAAEGRALLAGIGRQFIDAFEIGNEPDLYGVFPWYSDRRGHLYWARRRQYDLSAYTKQFSQWSKALPNVPLAGPAASGPGWMGKLAKFISAEPRLKLVTYHRYPLRSCVTKPSQKGFVSIPSLLADSSSAGLAQGLASYVKAAHARKIPFRVGEMNSASCKGTPGVSDTFASALWALDALFNMASVGVDGVNFHMLPGAALRAVHHLPGQRRELAGIRPPRVLRAADVRPGVPARGPSAARERAQRAAEGMGHRRIGRRRARGPDQQGSDRPSTTWLWPCRGRPPPARSRR